MNSNKLAVMHDNEKAADELERILDFTYGKNRGAQIPGHTGNGQCKEEGKTERQDTKTRA